MTRRLINPFLFKGEWNGGDRKSWRIWGASTFEINKPKLTLLAETIQICVLVAEMKETLFARSWGGALLKLFPLIFLEAVVIIFLTETLFAFF